MDATIRTSLSKLTAGEELSFAEAEEVGLAMSGGRLSPVVIAAFLGGLAARGETASELGGFVAAMRQRMRRAVSPYDDANAQKREGKAPIIVDTCGTGGDHQQTFNVSTATAIVLSACGLIVAKHGNRSVTSACGSADVLEALGVSLDLSPDQAKAVLKEVGMVFFFAPAFHPSMKHVVPVRRELGVRSLFNLLGPMLNPMPLDFQLIGVFSPHIMKRYHDALVHTTLQGALIVHSEDGLDEISLVAPTRVIEYRRSEDPGAHSEHKPFREYIIDPRDYGLSLVSPQLLRGSDPKGSGEIINELFSSHEGDEALRAKRHIVALNAAALLVLVGLASDIGEGVAQALKVMTSGGARKVLATLISTTQAITRHKR